ncbi:MAG: IS1595 family transposase [Planctomycetes bacterium]|nr:IS1595 family transposase [Planctomycetota bacterium]
MAYQELSLLQFKKKFPSERACQKELGKMRWPNGFVCPKCSHARAYERPKRHLFECAGCGYQASLTAGTVFHKTRTPLVKWFWAIYLVSQDKGGVSALRLAKQLELGYKTAWAMLHKIRKAMGQRDSRYTLSGFIEMDDAFFGGASKGKRGRGAANKSTVLVMVESKEEHAGFIAMQKVDSMERSIIEKTVKERIAPAQKIRTDGHKSYSNLNELGHSHDGAPVPSNQASEELPWVHTAISNAKRFILGTYHGVSHKHLQRYLDEFCYRFNRRSWEKQLTDRLMTACVNANPVTFAELKA